MALPPSTMSEKPMLPQGLSTSLLNRVRNNPNPLFIASLPPRGSKRTTSTRINYAEDYDFDFDFEENDNDDEYHDDDFARESIYAANTVRPNPNGVNLSNFQGKEAPRDKSRFVFNEFESINNCSAPQQLIPIKIQLETNGNKLNDLFMWNLNESLITPDQFANQLCLDLELPKSAETNISNQLKEQIDSYIQLLSIPIPSLNNESNWHAVFDISINLDNQLYEDKIEWDLFNSKITPEEFAATVVTEMGLQREFLNAIALSLHDAIYKQRKELLESPQHILYSNEYLPTLNKVYQPKPTNSNTTVSNTGLNGAIVNGNTEGHSTVGSVELQGLRYDDKKFGSDFGPKVETLTAWEIEKREIERERNLRRQKRETTRGTTVVGGGAGSGGSVGVSGGSGTSERSERVPKRRYDELEGTWKNI